MFGFFDFLFQLNVQVVSTQSALHFFDPKEILVKCYTDADEWISNGMSSKMTSSKMASRMSSQPRIHSPFV